MKITRRVITPTFAQPTSFESTTERNKTIAACREAAEAIRFDATALPLHALDFIAGHDGVRLNAVVLVPDRGGKDEALLITRSAIQPWEVLEFNGPEYLVRWTAETLCGLMAHEVYESVRYRGALVIDQHAPLSAPAEAAEAAP
jgi:hypothetical protein